MNIIFVSNSMARPKTLSLLQVLLLVAALVALSVILTLAFILPQGSSKHQGVKSLIPNPLQFTLNHHQEHLDALALQLGEIQARVTRLDALGDRLAELAGMKEKELETTKSANRGGPQVNAYGLTEEQLKQKIDELMAEVEHRSDRLEMLESLLVQQSMRKSTMPSGKPVGGGYNSSGYGWRVDPFTGKMAFHEGLDFMASMGSPIYAAATGIVRLATNTPDYGKLIKIDHGSGLETRYAHASAILVKAGERVQKGQIIGKVGSTGRSTGAHLHFEVRMKGAPLDPRKYLQGRAKLPG
ncbi:MAG TPA: M23 family metallopeptidase [Methylophilaceae bacterium]|nr:M23 family metallopeptidase [Methylophilaceae bacterium]